MNPPPQPQQVVVVKSGCGKAAVIFGVLALIACLCVGGCFVAGLFGVGKAVDAVATEMKKAQDENEAFKAGIKIEGFKLIQTGSTQENDATFQITNTNERPATSILIEWNHLDESGKRIATNSAEIFEELKPGETRTERMTVGFLISTPAKSIPSVKRATPGIKAKP